MPQTGGDVSTTTPNVVLVTTDQQRFDTIGPRAPSFLRTPHCDFLRQQGITFSSAYSSAPQCIPARTNIMTGRTALSRGVGNNRIDRDRSLPTRLRELGYQTAAIGKMHFDSESPRVRYGFGEMSIGLDYYREKQASGAESQPMRHGLGQTDHYPGMSTVPESETLTAWITEECVDYIRERRDPTVPFFLWCSYSKPHPPWDPPEPYYSMYEDSPIPQPIESEWSRDGNGPEALERKTAFTPESSNVPADAETVEAARAAYYGLVTQVDYNLGRIIAALRETGALENTVILYTADHGEFLGDHNTWAKGRFHEPSAHVPCVLRLPTSWDDRRAGTVCSDPVQLVDVFATAVEAAGGDPPPESDGQSLIRLARGELADKRTHAVGARPYYIGITDGRWKYIWYPPGGDEQLFDLEEDPEETTDLSNNERGEGKKRELRNTLLQQWSDSEFVEDGSLVTEPLSAFEPTPLGESYSSQIFTDYYRDRDVLH